ncbi:MAG: GNAT family N-acetyltransferase [Proteobacteria bacterium]|nr:GNAT family N-acetyltransferase [Pseudomonadota bacterium]
MSGTYLSFFEDIDKGKRVVVSSVAELKQRGKSISISNELSTGRSWTLDGTILPGGHISGVYSADATFDEGVGTFYLRIQNNDLDGLWSGYDHINRITNSGRYWFRKMKSVDIENAVASDITDILAISTKVFGNGYLGDLDRFIDSPHSSLLVAKSKKKIAGFCLSYLNPKPLEDVVDGYNGPIPDDVMHANNGGRLGLIKSIAVDPRYWRRGVGSRLFSEAENELKRLGAECAIVPAWVYRDTANIGGILKRHGYDFWFWNRTYWKHACENREFTCVKFDGQCNCSVAFYKRSLV